MLLSLIAAVNVLQLMASRVPFAMSRDRLLPALLHRVNPGGTPVPALVASTLVALVCIATNTFNTVLAMLAFMVAAVVSDRTHSMLSLALLGISGPVHRLIRPRTSAMP